MVGINCRWMPTPPINFAAGKLTLPYFWYLRTTLCKTLLDGYLEGADITEKAEIT